MAKFAAKGSKFSYLSGSTYIDVAQIRTIGLGQGSTELIDVTTLDTSASREFVNGFKDSDEITLEIKYDPANSGHEYLRNAHGGSAIGFRVTLSDTGTATFTGSALVTGFSINLDTDGPIDATVTLKPTGTITFAA